MDHTANLTRRQRRSEAGKRVALAAVAALATLAAVLALGALLAGPAAAQSAPQPPPIPVPEPPHLGGGEPIDPGPTPVEGDDPASVITIDLGGDGGDPSQAVVVILGLTLLSLAPSLLIMTTSFVRMVVVLSLTRNALGLQAIPPNQVVIGLALFLSLFVMAPTLAEMNEVALQPLLSGELSYGEAFDEASQPLRQFMLANTRTAELEMMVSATGGERPDTPDDVPLTTVIPAFILSELKTAFIIGFVIFVPFLVIDLVVSAVLMSLGMMMLPPIFVSLPFKILLFVMVDGWTLVAETLIAGYT